MNVRVVRVRASLRRCVIAGSAVFAFSAVEALALPLRPCGDLPASYPPIVAFELARTPIDLNAIFGLIADDCRSLLTLRMDIFNWADALLFVPLYGAFLLFFCTAMRAQTPRLARLTSAAIVIALVADTTENICLLSVTPTLDAHSVAFRGLAWATGLKWLALGVIAALGGVCAVSSATKPAIVDHLSWLIGVAALSASVAAVLNPSAYGCWLAGGIAASWVCFAAVAFSRLLAARKAPLAPDAFQPLRAGQEADGPFN